MAIICKLFCVTMWSVLWYAYWRGAIEISAVVFYIGCYMTLGVICRKRSPKDTASPGEDKKSNESSALTRRSIRPEPQTGKLTSARAADRIEVGSTHAAGIDLYVVESELKWNSDKTKFTYKSTYRSHIPEGMFGMIVPRSSTAEYISIIGIIDADFKGDIKITGTVVKPGCNFSQPIAQIIFIPCSRHTNVTVRKSIRGAGCFGSTNGN